MLDIKLTGTFPTIPENPMPEVMKEVANLMEASILRNFSTGGYGRWAKVKVGSYQTPVIGNLGGETGPIASAITARSDENSAEAGLLGSYPVYAPIHQFGGRIQHPGVGYMSGFNTPKIRGKKSKAAYSIGGGKLQVFTIGGTTIFTMRTKPHAIDIPARPYVMFQPEDVDAIHKLIPDAILRGIRHERID